jgi:hypothetical protein
MRNALITAVALCVVLAPLSSATAASKHAKKMPPSRYAAIEACTQQARDQHPSTGTPDDDARARSFAYAACMASKGQPW